MLFGSLRSAAVSRAEAHQPWGGAATGEWGNASRCVLLTDMTQVEPRDRLSKSLQNGMWKVIPYEMVAAEKWGKAPYDQADIHRGSMIWAAPEAAAPTVSLPLGSEGWYAIFVGLFSASEAASNVWLKLNTDPAPLGRSNGCRDYYGNVEEVFFKAARLTKDSRLTIRQMSGGFSSSCGITHVRLIPLTDDEIERIQADRGDRSNRRMTASIDGFSFMYAHSPRDAEILLAQVELFRNTDFGRLILHSPGADKVTYRSAAGGYLKGSHAEGFPRVGDRYFVESVRELDQKGINPERVLIDGAHDLGMEVHVAIRPAGWSFYEPFSDYWESPFFRDHPQWHCVDHDGTPVTRMSWAVPEVRRHLINILAERVRFGADGAHIVFNRGYPVVLHEPPVRELFREKHGEKPMGRETSDVRVIALWSDIVTTFFRELRARLDEGQVRRGDGRHLAISITVLGSEMDNLQYGVDVRRLVAEKLVDEILIYPFDFGARQAGYDLAFFKSACSPRRVRFSPALATHWPFEKQLAQAFSFAESGAWGITVWDESGGDVFEWSVRSRLGHTAETRRRVEQLDSSKPPRTYYYFHKLGSQIRDGRFPPFWGG
jgi:hypothetical protein